MAACGWKAVIYLSSLSPAQTILNALGADVPPRCQCGNLLRSEQAVGESMTGASAQNHWEMRIERRVPLKRHIAYRALTGRIAEWWWHPSSHPVSDILVDWRANGIFQAKAHASDAVQEGIILEMRPGWYFYMTDALRYSGRPGTPSMVGFWSVGNSDAGFCTHTAVIRHFSEADYQQNLTLGFEQGWNEAADRFVKLCEEGIR